VSKPFFSIGVTTYNRHDLLKEAVSSILSQNFHDFEVIIGNDYQDEILTAEKLGIADPRVRFVNHPRNLREVGNMNALLGLAEGRYFTWLFDDDLYEPGFLQTAHDVLLKNNFPSVLFPSYKVFRDTTTVSSGNIAYHSVQIFDGREYLKNYFSGRAKLISTCGLFDTEALIKVVGGVAELSSSAVGLYCEYYLLVRCALLNRIAYMDAPFVIFRAHSGSWGESHVELATCLEAGEELLRRSSKVLRHPNLRKDYEQSLLGILKIHLSTLSFVSVRVMKSTDITGILAAGRSGLLVLNEGARLGELISMETLMPLRARLRKFLIFAKCMYLVCFAVFYYSWRKRKDSFESTS